MYCAGYYCKYVEIQTTNHIIDSLMVDTLIVHTVIVDTLIVDDLIVDILIVNFPTVPLLNN